MKTLLLLRHAKSSWVDISLADHDRPLSERGREDAPRMGRLLEEADILPGVILSSTSKRTRETVELLVNEISYNGEFVYLRSLYHGGMEEILAVLKGLDDMIGTVMVVGHNPGMEEAVEDISGEHVRMPTAALVLISLPINSWQDMNWEIQGKLEGSWTPREL